jgi:anti-sigma regulatory factor (Ser/Thr protein kinase)
VTTSPVCVDLEIEPDPRLVRLVRLVASGVASVSGLSMEETEDCRIAIDELCATLIEVGGDGTLEVQFKAADDGLHASGRIRRGDTAPDEERLAVSRRIVTAVCDRFELVLDRPVASFTFFKGLEDVDPG